MASTVDLTNKSAQAGALAALDIILKSRKSPIPVEPGGGSGGGQLKPPKHTKEAGKSKPIVDDGPDKPGDSPNDQPGTEVGKGTTVTKTGDDKGNSQAGENGNGQDTGSSQNNGQDNGNSKKGSSLFDQEKNEKTLQGIKDDMWAKQEAERVKANQQAGWDNMIKNATAADFSELEDDLYYAIAAQVGESKTMDDTWEHGDDPVYADGDLMRPQQDFEEQKVKPLIYVFFDQSGSFGKDLINKGKSVLKVLDDFVQDGKIMQPKLFVFGNNVAECDENGNYSGSVGGGTHGWPRCLNIIKQSQDLPIGERCTNVLVLSDDDIQDQTDWGTAFSQDNWFSWDEKISIEGCVFWCWANDLRGKVCEDYLQGEKGNFVYKF